MNNLNMARLGEIAGWLEAGALKRGEIVGFNMQEVYRLTECGSTCCIAGAAISFYEEPYANVIMRFARWNGRGRIPEHPGNWNQIMATAAVLLGLDTRQAIDLFAPGESQGIEADFEVIFTTLGLGHRMLGWKSITPDWAARCIRNLMRTGFVDWRATKHAPLEASVIEQIAAPERELEAA